MPSVWGEREDLQGRVTLDRLNSILMETKILGMMTRDISGQAKNFLSNFQGLGIC